MSGMPDELYGWKSPGYVMSSKVFGCPGGSELQRSRVPIAILLQKKEGTSQRVGGTRMKC